MRRSLILCVLILSVFILVPAVHSAAPDDAPRYEIRKFRFRSHKHKDFERLVVEFKQKGSPSNEIPNVRIDGGTTGKEANIIIEQATLVGAIPEALINDSYVTKSDFLGPISINTDGPTTGFSLRTFLKEPVSVDAFWLNNPSRLVLDVFPSNSPRVAARVPDPEPAPVRRKLASLRASSQGSDWKESNPNEIVCYPVSAAVSASVNFTPRNPSAQQFSAVELVAPNGQMQARGPEPVVCFLASAQVVASVAFQTKMKSPMGYTQWGGSFDSSQGSLFGASSVPAKPFAPAALAPRGPASAPPPVAVGPKPPGLVVPDITPGRTPLGAPLQAPGSIGRMPGSSAAPSAKFPAFGSFGAPSGGQNALSNPLAPPTK